MIFRFILLSDEADDFMREIQIDSEATFLELNDIILDSVQYTKDQMTSFFICNDYWEKEQEITLIEMDTSSEFDNLVMLETRLEEFISDEGQKLMFVFDYLNERAFFIELKEIIPGKDLKKAICKATKGAAPVQVLDNLFMDNPAAEKRGMSFFESDDFQLGMTDDEEFNDDDLDNLNIDDNYFENQEY
jgi:hypothetical protein